MATISARVAVEDTVKAIVDRNQEAEKREERLHKVRQRAVARANISLPRKPPQGKKGSKGRRDDGGHRTESDGNAHRGEVFKYKV